MLWIARRNPFEKDRPAAKNERILFAVQNVYRPVAHMGIKFSPMQHGFGIQKLLFHDFSKVLLRLGVQKLIAPNLA